MNSSDSLKPNGSKLYLCILGSLMQLMNLKRDEILKNRSFKCASSNSQL